MGIKVDFKSLKSAVDWSIQQLGTPRKNRVEALREFVGNHYSDHGSEKRVPTNMLELAATIYVQQLAAKAPQVMITAKSKQLRPFAYDMQLALNQIPEEIDLGDTLQGAVLEGIFGFAVVKVGTCISGNCVLGHDPGEPFVDLVSADDYFCDMSAKSRKSMQFEGNDYWLPIDVARARWSQEDIEPDGHTVTGDQGEERAEGVSADEGADLYKEKVWCRDVYIFDTKQLVTYGVKSGKIFDVIDWDGPDHSPYHMLGFSDVPGNLLPLPPVALWRDLHELGNSLFRKLANQGDNKKTVAAFQGGNDDDVDALRRAKDGDGIVYSGQKPESITVGGIDAATLAFYLQTKDLFSYFAGNLDTLGGLSPMSDTVGQEGLLGQAAGARMSRMRDKTLKFVKGIFKVLAWYEWTDPVRERIIEKKVKDTDISLRRVWSAETREGDFLDYNLDIDVYSMQDDSPEIQLQKIGQIFERFVLPLLPQIERQGGSIDTQRLFSKISELSHLPLLDELIVFGDAPDEVPIQGNPQPSTMPAHTTRTYERVNRPGSTRHGKDDSLSRILMGGGAQPDEVAAIGRPTG